jgi:hypothetical protein
MLDNTTALLIQNTLVEWPAFDETTVEVSPPYSERSMLAKSTL